MDQSRLVEEYNKIKNLHQYRNYDRDGLMQVSYKRLVERYADLDSLLDNKDELNNAKALLQKYLLDFTPETISDIQTLRSVIFLETLNFRLQKLLNQLYENNNSQPLHLVDTVHKNLKNIQELKMSLGMTKEGRKTEEKDSATKIESYKKQFKLWRENNQASRNITCPDCGQMVWLKMRTDAWEAQRHPFFKDRILYNEHLVKMFMEGNINKEDVAKIFQSSEDYIDWVINKWHKRKEYEKRQNKTENPDS